MARLRPAGRLVWVVGGVLLCVYIVFDVLDLDGSQLPRYLGSDILVIASAPLETERYLHCELIPASHRMHPSACMPAGQHGTWGQRFSAEGSRSPSRYGPLLPRRQLAVLGDSPASDSSDPA